MAKKTISQVQEELAQMSDWKWQFLRRNEDYIKSCEEWSKRSRKQWKENEIVLGYPFDGQMPPFLKKSGPVTEEELFSMDDLGLYPKKLFLEWNGDKHSWEKYFTLHRLLLPMNPSLEHLPFFARFETDFDYIIVPRKVMKNDAFFDEGTMSAIVVDWSQHKESLKALFERLVNTMQGLLRVRGKKTRQDMGLRVHMKKYSLYLKAWDARHKDRMSWSQLMKLDFEGKKIKHISTIRGYVRAAENLIRGGYKNIG